MVEMLPDAVSCCPWWLWCLVAGGYAVGAIALRCHFDCYDSGETVFVGLLWLTSPLWVPLYLIVLVAALVFLLAGSLVMWKS